MFTPREHERVFSIKPVGVKYICEFCGEGEMKHIPSSEVKLNIPPLFNHKCTNCGKIMMLPKMYPYIEWIPAEEESNE